MEFDRSKVYTALNADELKPGSKVFVADNLATLKEYVDSERSMATIKHIANDSQEHRFIVQFDSDPNTCAWGFAYLVSEPEEKNWIAYLSRKSSNPEDYYLTACRSDRWESVKEDYGAKTKLFEGSEEEEVDNWYVARRHLANEIAAWEDGKTIQFFEDSTGRWNDVVEPKWSTHSQYRVKPEGLKWTDLKIGDIIRYNNIMTMVTAIDDSPSTKSHIYGYDWISDGELEDYKKVE